MSLKNEKPSEILQTCADILLGNPEVFTQHAYARDKAGEICDITDPNAVQFCARGLILAALEENDITVEHKAFVYLRKAADCGSKSIEAWNNLVCDEHGKVAQCAFAAAADLARKEGA